MKTSNAKWNSIVPQPQFLECGQEEIPISRLCLASALASEGPFAAEAKLLASRHPQLQEPKEPNSAVVFVFEYDVDMAAETYHLGIERHRVLIRANTGSGAFYATVTLSQWLWQYAALPVAQVHDAPRFAWRGYMLDVSRHFFPPSYLKQLMEQLACYKINRLHLHLTDDQGWRLPIEQYPNLTEFGSRRYWATDHFYNQKPAPAQFYTVENIKELNELADALHIQIVPEIDLPGHASAAIASYPELSCQPFRKQDVKVQPIWGVSQNVLCLGQSATWAFIYAVLDEVADMFPSPYVHLGGDEVMHDHWNRCPDCQGLMKAEGITDGHGLQNLFTRRSRDYLIAKGKQPLYWDEVVESGLSEGTICCFWRSWPRKANRGNGMAETWDFCAARKGVQVISCPVDGAYLDYKHNEHPHEAGNIGVLTVYDSYHWLPLADKGRKELENEEERFLMIDHSLGVQANLWTECVQFPKDVEYMTFPRLLAIAEKGWYPLPSGWDLFKAKWPIQQKVLQTIGVQNYYRGPWQ